LRKTPLSAFPLLCAILLLVGCRPSGAPRIVAPPAKPPVAVTRPAPVRPAIDLMTVRPNEVGYIPVLMYHAIGASSSAGTRYDRHGLNIAPETFRDHLQRMYDAGWRPINMRDALTGRIDVPAGRIPVVITFDDARGTQLRYLPDGSMDPDCAVAIMEQFHATRPDWPLRASFYILPKSKWNPVPFYQPGREARKLQYLVSQGYELANHSTSHRRMDRMDAHTLAWEMAECVRYVRARAPRATMDTMALPMGYVPRTRALLDVLLKGSEGGTQYENRCILRAWGGPTLPPTHRDFDPRKVLRIGSDPGNVESWIKHLKRGGEMEPFVSDGSQDTVTVPKRFEKFLCRPRLTGQSVVTYEDRPPKPKSSAKPVQKQARS